MEEEKRTAVVYADLHRLYRCIVLLALIHCSLLHKAYGQAIEERGKQRKALQSVFRAELGKDDRQSISQYLRYTDLTYGYEWCAAFVSWCFAQAGYPQPRTPWSPALFPANRTVWKQGQAVADRQIKTGMVWGVHILSKGRIGHTGFVDVERKGIITTVEGNTKPLGSKGANGVYRKRRALRTIRTIAEWL